MIKDVNFVKGRRYVLHLLGSNLWLAKTFGSSDPPRELEFAEEEVDKLRFGGSPRGLGFLKFGPPALVSNILSPVCGWFLGKHFTSASC